MAKRHSRAKQRAYLAAQKKNRYNANEAGRLDRIEQAVEAMAGQLDNLIMQNVPLEGENVEMANQKIRRHIELNGKKHWINAATEQEYAEKLQALAMANAPEQPAMKNLNADKHLFKTYAEKWYRLDVLPEGTHATATCVKYRRQLDKYIIPALGNKFIEDIGVDDVLEIFNGMSSLSKASKQEVQKVLNMIFSAAYQDDALINRNPMRSKRVKNAASRGKASVPTQPYSVEQMQYLAQHVGSVKKYQDRAFLVLSILHPLRLEEVLGLKWKDVDLENGVIHVRMTVTHPRRNRPEYKPPKTERSKRDICLTPYAAQFLEQGEPEEFVIGGNMLSYQQTKCMCERIRKDTAFDEDITPRRFRTTVLTDIYDQTKDIKQAQTAAGHTTSAMTLNYYVHGRQRKNANAEVITAAYLPESC